MHNRGIHPTSIIINFVKKIHFILNSRFLQTDHAMPFAFRPVIFQRHRPTTPHHCEFRARWPGAGRALEGKGEEAQLPNWGSKKWWDFFHPKMDTKKIVSRHSPTNPLLYPAIGFFATPTGGCYGELLLPPKNGRCLFWWEWPGNKHVVAIFWGPGNSNTPGNYTLRKPTRIRWCNGDFWVGGGWLVVE